MATNPRETHAMHDDATVSLRELEAQGVDISLLIEQLRLTPTARIESMLRLLELCDALATASRKDDNAGQKTWPWCQSC